MSESASWPGGRAQGLPFSLLGHLLPTGGREEQHPLKIIGQILEPALCSSPDHANGSNELAAHRHHLVAKDMFDANLRSRSMPIALFLLSRQRLVPVAFFLNVGAEGLPLE